MNMPAPQPTIQDLFPTLTPDEVKRVEENLDAYLALVIRVYTRISQDPQALAELRAALYAGNKNIEKSPLTIQP
jgi:hypothetical protein